MLCFRWGPISARLLPLAGGVNTFRPTCDPTGEFHPSKKLMDTLLFWAYSSAELSCGLQPKAVQTCPNWLCLTAAGNTAYRAHHGRLSSACDMRKRRKTSAYPGSCFLWECKAVSERRLRLAMVWRRSGAKAQGSMRGHWQQQVMEGDSAGKGHFT